jgi:hypothetical protein
MQYDAWFRQKYGIQNRIYNVQACVSGKTALIRQRRVRRGNDEKDADEEDADVFKFVVKTDHEDTDDEAEGESKQEIVETDAVVDPEPTCQFTEPNAVQERAEHRKPDPPPSPSPSQFSSPSLPSLPHSSLFSPTPFLVSSSPSPVRVPKQIRQLRLAGLISDFFVSHRW